MSLFRGIHLVIKLFHHYCSLGVCLRFLNKLLNLFWNFWSWREVTLYFSKFYYFSLNFYSLFLGFPIGFSDGIVFPDETRNTAFWIHFSLKYSLEKSLGEVWIQKDIELFVVEYLLSHQFLNIFDFVHFWANSDLPMEVNLAYRQIIVVVCKVNIFNFLSHLLESQYSSATTWPFQCWLWSWQKFILNGQWIVNLVSKNLTAHSYVRAEAAFCPSGWVVMSCRRALGLVVNNQKISVRVIHEGNKI